jgi:energy-coupling factor transporter transmembrane protein EcfT
MNAPLAWRFSVQLQAHHAFNKEAAHRLPSVLEAHIMVLCCTKPISPPLGFSLLLFYFFLIAVFIYLLLSTMIRNYYVLYKFILVIYMLLCWVNVFDLNTGYRPLPPYSRPDFIIN